MTATTDSSNPSLLPAEEPGWARNFSILTVALGLIVLFGWSLDIDILKRLLPGLVSMKANTAIAFILSGIALYLHTLRQLPPTALIIRCLCASLVLLLGLVTLSEYFFGWNAGIDQLLFAEPAGAILTSHPGRMSDITAINFALIGGALLLMEARLWMAVQVISLVVAAITLLSIGGYLFGNLSLLQVGAATSIAAQTAAAFLMLSTGILMTTQSHVFMLWAREKAQIIGLTTSLVMLFFIFAAASYNFVQRDQASQHVEHTYEAIISMESFATSLTKFLYHNRGYLISAEERQLFERKKHRDTLVAEFSKIRQLISHDALHQERWEALNKLVAQRLDRADLAVQLRREKGFEASVALVASGKGDVLLDTIETKLDELTDTERTLLKDQQKIAETVRYSSFFTLGALIFTSLLLLLWVFRTSRHEMAERKLMEEKIHELNRGLELRVIERTTELEAANKDMESFSYSISHDLRAPLRAINGFSKILHEEYAGQLDDEGKRLLNVVGDNARKMGELIDDILAFSRAGRNEVEHSVIDMKKMVVGVWEELKPERAERDIQLELIALPPVDGDAAMIHQVVFNLLSNAVKFTQQHTTARIKVGGQVEGQETIYHVKDNGAGFNMQYANKLFGVFARLHGTDEFEGTGIGLAIVKRIITKHGGRVWAEGKVNEGATFYFALPNSTL